MTSEDPQTIEFDCLYLRGVKAVSAQRDLCAKYARALKLAKLKTEIGFTGIAKLLTVDCEEWAKAISCRHFGGIVGPEVSSS